MPCYRVHADAVTYADEYSRSSGLRLIGTARIIEAEDLDQGDVSMARSASIVADPTALSDASSSSERAPPRQCDARSRLTRPAGGRPHSALPSELGDLLAPVVFLPLTSLSGGHCRALITCLCRMRNLLVEARHQPSRAPATTNPIILFSNKKSEDVARRRRR